MLTYNNISVCEDEVLYIEKEDKKEEKNVIYSVCIHLKNQGVIPLKYLSEDDRDRTFNYIISDLRTYQNNKETIIAEELARLRRSIEDIDYRNKSIRKRTYLTDSAKIESLGLKSRICNCLLRNGIRTIGDVRKTGYEALAYRGSTGIRSFGRESLKELCEKIEEKTGEPLQ